MNRDMLMVLLMTAVVVIATGVLGASVLQLIRRRSLLLSIVVAALVPVAAVSAAVALNVNKMVISAHDTAVVSVALGFASVLSVALSYVLGHRVVSGSRELAQAVRGLAVPTPAGAAVSAVPTWSSAPAEITQLAAELETTRTSLHASRSRERALEQSRRELVAFMSHDLRTPLAGLRALAEGMEDGVIEDQAAALRQMRQTVERMNGLVGDLFELSRLHSGTPEVRPVRSMVSLVELAHDVVGEARAHARQEAVTVLVDVDDDDDRLAVQGNSDELARALSNLVGNAVRHTDIGGQVVVSARRGEDGRARVAVTDACGGIDEADLDRLFDVGWRAEPERSRDAGAGLGLAIAKGVVESHAGSISVVNVTGGCRFDIDLPAIAREHQAQQAQQIQQARLGSAEGEATDAVGQGHG